MNFTKNVREIVISIILLLLSTSNLFAQITMGDYTSHTFDDSEVVVYASDSALRFSFIDSDIVKVEFFPVPETDFDASHVVIREEMSGLILDVNDTNNWIEIITSQMIVRIEKYPVRVSYSNGFDVLISESEEHSIEAIGDQRQLNFVIDPSDHFYGTGERSVSLDLHGEEFDIYNQAIYGYGQPPSNMNINVPLILSSNFYALLIDNTWTGHYNLGAINPGHMSLTCNGGEMVYYLITAPSIADQIRRYHWLTGYQPLPPKWSLGYLQSKYGYHDETQARNIVNEFSERGIPLSGLILDLYWFSNMGDYSWDYSAFPNPTQMIQDFADEGIQTVLITEPIFNAYSNNYDFLLNTDPYYIGGTTWGGQYIYPYHWSCACEAVLLDITNPDASDWLQDKYEILLQDGVGGFWTDLGEPENHPDDMTHFAGPSNKIHNIYNLLWAKCVHDAFAEERPDQRIFNLTRSGWAGIQRYGVNTWSGDVSRTWDGLATQRAMLLNMGMSGIAYHSSDLGGFTGNTTPELYIRWMQFGAFNPIMRAHGYEDQPTEPWGQGTQAEGIVRDFIKLRFRLVPYIYSMAYFNSISGIPIARPLIYLEPGDEISSDYKEAYMFGDNFLVAPVVQDQQRTKSIQFPYGQWVNYWTDEIIDGNQLVTVSAPLEQIPLFVKRGSIIPQQTEMLHIDENPLDTLIISFYPDPNSYENTFSLYEDDGISKDYNNGEFALTSIVSRNLLDPPNSPAFSYTVNPTEGTFDGMPDMRYILAEIHLYQQEDVTFINTINLDEYNTLGELRSHESGYYLDTDSDILYVQNSKMPSEELTVTISEFFFSVDENIERPNSFFLAQNFPNPFNPITEIRYGLAEPSDVTLTIYNILGQKVKTLVSEFQQAGKYNLTWDATTDNDQLTSSGIYICIIEAGSFRDTIRMVVLK